MKCRSGIIAAIATVMLLPAVLQAGDKPAATADAKAKKTEPKQTELKQSEAKCEYLTGSRIRHDPPVNCDQAMPGLRSFSADEINNTGQLNLGDALRMLDPQLR